ncbi:MAG: hypothetical protein WED10_06650 [Brumimicrobium sp.]
MENINTRSGFWDRFFAGGIEFNRYALISAILLLVGCMGGLTVGYGAINNTLQLSLVVLLTMTTLSLLLALAPMKYVMSFAVVTIIVDVIILTINLLG